MDAQTHLTKLIVANSANNTKCILNANSLLNGNTVINADSVLNTNCELNTNYALNHFTHRFTDKDDVKPYDIYGVTVGEVEVDLLTGQHQVSCLDIEMC